MFFSRRELLTKRARKRTRQPKLRQNATNTAAARHRATAGHPETGRWTGRAHPRSRPRPHRCHLRCTHRRRHQPRGVVRASDQRRPRRRHARPRNDLARPHRQPRRVPRQPVATAVLDTPRDDTDKGRRLRRRRHRPDAAPRGTHRRSASPDHCRPRRDPPSAHRARPTPLNVRGNDAPSGCESAR